MPSRSTSSLFDPAPSTAPLYAEVIIPIATPQNFTWSVPDALRHEVKVGIRVEVNLGNKRRYAGLIKRLHNESPQGFKPKPILQVLDQAPIVQAMQISFWAWMAKYYMCSEGEVMAAALPAFFKLSSESWLCYLPEFGEDLSGLDDLEYLLAEALLIKKQLRIAEIQQILQQRNVYLVINRLVEKGVAQLIESLQDKYTVQYQTFISLSPALQQEAAQLEWLDRLERAPKQRDLLLAYLDLAKETTAPVAQKALLRHVEATTNTLHTLIEKGVLVAEKKPVNRIERMAPALHIDFVLSESQEKALESLNAQWGKQSVCLLRGVTGSGKTHVYIRLIAEALSAGKQVLYLLPEIALTSQVIRRLQHHFGGTVGVYHSRFSSNERVEIWKEVAAGRIRVVLGARSALFLPFDALGLIICDEEHDASFKQQDPAPRYHARDSAIYLATLHQAKVLLGSATPSLESFYQAQTGKYGYAELTDRFGVGELPTLRFIDTRAILKEDQTRISLTPALIKKIGQVLDKKRQIILFQNRRGYSPYQLCTSCGWIPRCEQCDVSLTYHKKQGELRCHYCGTQYPLVSRCHACGHTKFGQRSFGTERVEEQLHTFFPGARIARMDIDTTRGKYAHDQLIQQFESGEVDILVGTQMVVKGLDFDRVDLVGILDADGLLHFADFRASERAFQLMEQVSGRAGRKAATGEVIVQTADPDHPILLQVAAHDYLGFYASELKKRISFGYPPGHRMIRILFRHKDPALVERTADAWASALPPNWKKMLIGPAEPLIARIRGQYRVEAWMRVPRNAQGISEAKAQIRSAMDKIAQHKLMARVEVVLDVDPMG